MRRVVIRPAFCDRRLLAAKAPILAAQDTVVLMPEQSAAKAKQLIQQSIDAFGGSAYLNMRDITCSGRAGQFGHSGELNGYARFVDYVEPPTMERTENLPQRNIVEVYNGDKGWTMDRSGVSGSPFRCRPLSGRCKTRHLQHPAE